jgi:hypothetical protein
MLYTECWHKVANNRMLAIAAMRTEHVIELRHGQKIRVGLRHASNQLVHPHQGALEWRRRA